MTWIVLDYEDVQKNRHMSEGWHLAVKGIQKIDCDAYLERSWWGEFRRVVELHFIMLGLNWQLGSREKMSER